MKVPMELEALGNVSGAVIRKGFALPTGFALLLTGGLIAGGLVFSALSQRYMVAQGFATHPVRVDRLTGAVEVCLARVRTTPRGKLNVYGHYLSYECGPELEQ